MPLISPSTYVDPQELKDEFLADIQGKYWGRVKEFVHKIPEAKIYECNREYIFLLTARHLGVLDTRNVSVELLREIDDDLDMFSYIDPDELCNPCEDFSGKAFIECGVYYKLDCRDEFECKTLPANGDKKYPACSMSECTDEYACATYRCDRELYCVETVHAGVQHEVPVFKTRTFWYDYELGDFAQKITGNASQLSCWWRDLDCKTEFFCNAEDAKKDILVASTELQCSKTMIPADIGSGTPSYDCNLGMRCKDKIVIPPQEIDCGIRAWPCYDEDEMLPCNPQDGQFNLMDEVSCAEYYVDCDDQISYYWNEDDEVLIDCDKEIYCKITYDRFCLAKCVYEVLESMNELEPLVTTRDKFVTAGCGPYEDC